MLPALKRLLTPAAVTIHWSPKEAGRLEGRAPPTARDLGGREAGHGAGRAGRGDKQTCGSDEALGVKTFPFSQPSPDI